MNARTKLIGTVVLGAALLAPVAQAQRPDDQAGPRGPGAVAAEETFVQGVTDFPGPSQAAPQVDGAPVRGDVKDGLGATSRSVVIVGDDKRDIGTSPSDGVLVGDDKWNVAGQYNQYAYRRALPQDLDAAPAQVVSTSAGFDWGDAAIGGLGGAGLALILTGFAFLVASQRNKARTA